MGPTTKVPDARLVVPIFRVQIYYGKGSTFGGPVGEWKKLTTDVTFDVLSFGSGSPYGSTSR